jgi:restriction system protein
MIRFRQGRVSKYPWRSRYCHNRTVPFQLKTAMARRRSQSNSFFDDLLGVLRVVPWWVGPPLIVLTWVLFRYILPAIFHGITEAQDNSVALPPASMISSLSVMLSPIIAGLIGLVWVIALFKKIGDSRRLAHQTGIESIRALTWRDFEHLLAEAFRRQGYRVRDTGGGADGGVDLILSKDGREMLVQAKQWKAWKVGVKVVRELFGVQVSRGSDAAILVTSGRFTGEARQFASENDIELIDGQVLERMIADVQRSGRTPQRPAAKGAAIEPATAPATPKCPACGSPMVQRTSKRGANLGQAFWGCSGFPACRGTRPVT